MNLRVWGAIFETKSVQDPGQCRVQVSAGARGVTFSAKICGNQVPGVTFGASGITFGGHGLTFRAYGITFEIILEALELTFLILGEKS